MTKLLPLITALLFTIHGVGQISNPGFEVWDTTYYNASEFVLINDYNVTDPLSGVVNAWSYESSNGITRTTDSYEGDYSVIIHNWYSTSMGYLYYKGSLQTKPDYLNGFYKYIGNEFNGNMSRGIGKITILDNTGDTVAHTIHYFDTTSLFTPFEIEINYLNNNDPDSISFLFQSADQRCGMVNICNLLYLDHLSLRKNMTGIKKRTSTHPMIYPNPTSGILYLSGKQTENEVLIYNITGKTLLHQRNIDRVDLSNFDPGIYFIQVKNISGLSTIKKVIKN